jgi:hypothetical protein
MPVKIRKPDKIFIDAIVESFDYNKKTGIVTVKKSSRKRKVGDPVGTISEHGYLRTQMCVGRKYCNVMVHHIAWFLHYGKWPDTIIDHDNTNRLDNKIKNLRKATSADNVHNSIKSRNNSKTGILGVCRYSHDKTKFEAYIQRRRIGVFDTLEEALKAREKEEKRLYKEFAPKRNKNA